MLIASLRPRLPEPRDARWRETMMQMAEAAQRHYRALVHEHPAFNGYFRAATPIDVIERLHIGSRPARRGGAPAESVINTWPLERLQDWLRTRRG